MITIPNVLCTHVINSPKAIDSSTGGRGSSGSWCGIFFTDDYIDYAGAVTYGGSIAHHPQRSEYQKDSVFGGAWLEGITNLNGIFAILPCDGKVLNMFHRGSPTIHYHRPLGPVLVGGEISFNVGNGKYKIFGDDLLGGEEIVLRNIGSTNDHSHYKESGHYIFGSGEFHGTTTGLFFGQVDYKGTVFHDKICSSVLITTDLS